MNRYQVTGPARDGWGKDQPRTQHIICAWTDDEAKEKWFRAHPKSQGQTLDVRKLPTLETLQRRMDASARKGAKK